MTDNKYFIDTGFLFAIFNRNEDGHESSKKILFELAKQKFRLFYSDYIFDELVTLSRSKIGIKESILIGNVVKNSSYMIPLSVDNEIKENAWDIFCKYDDKKYSFTDCTSFALMNELKIINALSFDSHFSQFGFNIFPKN